jgi:non-ribosomal peptide synthetase component F
MIELVTDHRISNCILTPTQFKVLFAASNAVRLTKWLSLRTIVLGGEQIPPWLVRDFYALQLPQAVIFNGYAPAETTVVNSLTRYAKFSTSSHGHLLNSSADYIQSMP